RRGRLLSRRTPSALLTNHVLDGLAGRGLNPADQVAAQPARARLRERRDHDVVGGVELQRVLDGRVRIVVLHLPDRVETGLLELLKRPREPLVGAAAALAVRARLRRYHDEAPRLLAGLALQS